MSSMLDRLNREIEAFGRKAQHALEEGKLHVEMLGLRRRRDAAARELGQLVYAEARKSGVPDAARRDLLLDRLDELERQMAKVQAEIRSERVDAVTVRTE